MLTLHQPNLTPKQIELNRRWIKALRSGTYIQGSHALKILDRDRVKYCCLGVVCEIKRLFNGPVFVRHNSFDLFGVFVSPWGASHSSNQPSLVLDKDYAERKLGLINGVGEIHSAIEFKNNRSNKSSLGSLNDNGFTFPQIADIIEYSLDNNV